MRCRALLFVALLLACGAIEAQAPRSIAIEHFHADVVVSPDAVVDVTETIALRFTGSWNGIYRFIPVEYRTPQGFKYRLFLDMIGITDGMGRSLRYQKRRDRHYLEFKIWIPGASDAVRTVVLRYRVQNGLKFFDGHDELYWNITGDEWEMPIQSASATIRLPDGAAGVRAVAFTGGYGSREQAANVTVNKNVVEVQTLGMLNFKEGLTAAVAWNPGVVRRPGLAAKFVMFLRSNTIFGIPIIVFLFMLWLWRVRGRDPRRMPIAAQYEPPEGMSPAEAGTLIDNWPDMRDITATLVDLAVRGYLLIEEVETEQLFGLWSKKDYVFTLRKPEPEWKDLRPHERELLDAMFAGGLHTSMPASALQNKFYLHLPHIRDQILNRLVNRRYYASRPDKVKRGYLIAAVIIGAAVFILSAAGSGIKGIQPGSLMAGLLTAAIVAGFGWFMPARTISGARALEKVLGFEEFLARVESDRFERVVKTPQMFEQFLPYAMALGVERNWARAFANIYRQAPEWYRGGDFATFHPDNFVSSLGRMSAQTASAMASAPRSSGGSGFGGGGGFSGGGFGGGGGRGF